MNVRKRKPFGTLMTLLAASLFLLTTSVATAHESDDRFRRFGRA